MVSRAATLLPFTTLCRSRNAAALRAAGLPAEARVLCLLDPDVLAVHSRVLLVVAIYGDGVAPDFARTFARKLREAPPYLDGLEYAVLALGDTDYEESFCGFGRELD